MINFIKKHWKWLLLLLLGGLLYLCYNLYTQNRNLKADKDRLLTNIKLGQQAIVEKENRVGELVSQVEVFRFKANELEKTNSDLSKRIQDFTKDTRDIQSYTSVTTESEGKIDIPLQDVVKDTLVEDLKEQDFRKSFVFDDTFLRLDGETTRDTVSIGYKYTTKLEVIHRWEPQGWFKDDKLVLGALTKNPNERIIGLEGLQIEPRDKRFYETNGFKIGSGVVVGIGLTALFLSL